MAPHESDQEARPRVTIYTDGGCEPNPGPGGWAAILRFGGHTRELSGAEAQTTNNRMELRAAVEGLRALKEPCRVDLYTDSEYLQRGMSEWMADWQARKSKKKPANWDLWQDLLEAAARHSIHWHWVQGHAGNRFNERAHALASAMLPAAARPPREPGASLVYVGASCPGASRGPCGWGIVMRSGGDDREYSGFAPKATANEMLLTAAEEALRRAPPGRPVRVYTSASYLYQGITAWVPNWQRHGWRTRDRKPVKSQEIWRRLAEASSRLDVEWHLVKADEQPELARASQLAMEAASRS